MSIVTLLTDFGQADWYAGVMHGILLSLNPRLQIVDLTHAIPPGNVRAGAFALATGAASFPAGTLHVAVVDPGVGSSRAPIAVRTRRFTFVGPDNGVLALALEREKITSIHRLENPRYQLPNKSQTFHGRDVFCPAAAHLSRGVLPQRLGPKQADYQRLPWPAPKPVHDGWRAEVVYIDHFGNCITNLTADALESRPASGWSVRAGGNRPVPMGPYYEAVPPAHPLALIGSSGFLEVAVNGGNAACRLRLRVGSAVEVRAKP